LWQEVYDSLIERAGITPGSSVLDIGTGTGEVALRACRAVGKRGRVVGVDSVEEMLRIARRKARRQGVNNVEFKRMSFEELEFPAGSFDIAVGNYSICCCLDYEVALKECLRILKPGGLLMYNHSGPADPLEFQLALKIFERYQTGRPSKRLREIREASLAQKNAVEKFRDPYLTLTTMRGLGFREAEATITQRVVKYKDAEAFLDRMLGFNWRNEANEIPNGGIRRFRSEAAKALGSLSTGPGFTVKDEMIFFSGLR
jgi:ubiquinone/menaquinone biosynthesis C-methylase UbiE